VRQDGTVRSGTGRVVGAAGILAALGTLLLGAPAVGASVVAAPAVGTVTVNPASGPPAAEVNATYRIPRPPGGCPVRANFFWDGQFVNSAARNRNALACVYPLSFLPPPIDRAPGQHVVAASAGTLDAGSATYQIEPAVSPSTHPSPSARPSRSATATPTRARTTPAAVVPSEEALPAPPTIDTSAAAAPPTAPVATPASSWTSWAMVAGGALVLGGVLVIGWLVVQNRRAARDDVAESDAATVEQPRLS
jgi:hypothetical protein